MSTDELISKVQELLPEEEQISIHTTLQKDKALTYQVILEVSPFSATTLLQRGRILIGFSACKIAPYRPIIRFNNCQKYGHSSRGCRGKEICQYCAKYHSSQSCSVKNNLDRHRCIHCLRTPDDFPHAASSNQCPVFKYHLSQRNSYINNRPINSM